MRRLVRAARFALANLLTGLLLSAALMGLAPAAAHAQITPPENDVTVGTPCGKGGSFLAFPTWYEYLPMATDQEGNCKVQLREESGALDLMSLWLIGLALIEILLRLAGLAAVLFVIYGGIKYIISQGQPDATKSARGTIQNALIGMVIAIIASALVRFLGSQLK